MTKYDIEKINKLKQEKKFKVKSCFHNSSIAKIGLGNSSYVEGFLITEQGRICEHGWIETDEGKIIDVTISDLNENYKYVPVNKYPGSDSGNIITKKTQGRTPIFMFDKKAKQKILKFRKNLINEGYYYPTILNDVYYNK